MFLTFLFSAGEPGREFCPERKVKQAEVALPCWGCQGSVRFPLLWAGWGQEAFLPHERGRGWRDSAGLLNRISKRSKFSISINRWAMRWSLWWWRTSARGNTRPAAWGSCARRDAPSDSSRSSRPWIWRRLPGEEWRYGTIQNCPNSIVILSCFLSFILIQVTVVRQPKGPDGTRGFRPRGSPRERTPAVMDLMEQLTAQ